MDNKRISRRSEGKRGQSTLMKTCKRCFREFDEEDVLDINPAIELADYLDSRFHGNDKHNDRR